MNSLHPNAKFGWIIGPVVLWEENFQNHQCISFYKIISQ